MTDHEENRLRQRLSEAYPTEPAPPAFLRRISETVAPHHPHPPIRSTAPSLSRRSWWIASTVAAVVAAGVTAIGLTIGSRPADSPLADGDPTADSSAPVTVALPTSDWTTGMIALAALAQGELVIGADGCLHIGGSAIVWPKGVYGVQTAPGVIEVYGPDGVSRARTGEVVTVGGGSGGTDPAGCASDGGRPFNVMDEGFVSGTPLPSDYGAAPEPTDSSVSSATAGG